MGYNLFAIISFLGALFSIPPLGILFGLWVPKLYTLWDYLWLLDIFLTIVASCFQLEFVYRISGTKPLSKAQKARGVYTLAMAIMWLVILVAYNLNRPQGFF